MRTETLCICKEETGFYSLTVGSEKKSQLKSHDPYFELIHRYIMDKFDPELKQCKSYQDLVVKLMEKDIDLQIADARRNAIIFVLNF